MIGLDISTVKVKLICEPPSLARMIAQKYNEYAFAGTPEYVIKIKWSRPNTDVTHRQATIDKVDGYFSQGSYIISSPQYSGLVNLQSAQAEFEYSSPTPIYDFEYFLRIVISHALYQKGGFLFHSAGIIRDDRAFLFFGKSGCGKTTVARHSTGMRILSDDLVGVLPAEYGVVAYSTPFWNPGWNHHERANARVADFYRLVKSTDVTKVQIPESLAVSEVLSSIPVVPLYEKFCANLIPVIQDVISQVGVYYLHFRPDNTFWDVVRHG